MNDSHNHPTHEQIKEAFTNSNLPVGHWETWLVAVAFTIKFFGKR